MSHVITSLSITCLTVMCQKGAHQECLKIKFKKILKSGVKYIFYTNILFFWLKLLLNTVNAYV